MNMSVKGIREQAKLVHGVGQLHVRQVKTACHPVLMVHLTDAGKNFKPADVRFRYE